LYLDKNTYVQLQGANMKRALLVAVLAVVACQPSLADQPVNISGHAANKADADLIKVAVNALKLSCPAFLKSGADLQNVTVEFTTPYWQERDLGWARMVEVKVDVVGSPKTLPAQAGGHTCRYDIGSGEKPGISTSKTACRLICGWPEEFYSIPQLAGVFGDKPFKRDYDLEAFRTGAMRGDYQSQRNLAYVMETEKRDVEGYDPFMACVWRQVILASGHRQADMSDVQNEKIACGHLSKDQQDTAHIRAQLLLKEIKSAPRAKKRR
jgi:hypothetical protein